jgi:hypothetical protein
MRGSATAKTGISSRRCLAVAACACLLPATCGALDSESLRQLISEKRVTSIERLLEFLPFPLLSRYALVFNSRSLQESSYRNPRVILFGDDARFIVAFNGDPGQRGYDVLEVMEFDEPHMRFIFREFQFHASEQNMSVTASEPNPEKCLSCHGEPARPIWDTHPAWPGAYGERYRAPLGKAEKEGLESFLAKQATHPRYRALKDLRVFTDRNTFYPSAIVRYDGAEVEPPNAVLSRLLGDLNVHALAHELVASPKFSEYQYALLVSLSTDCAPLEDYIPEDIRVEFMSGFESFSTSTRQRNLEQEQLKRLRMSAPAYDAARVPEGDMETLTAFRYVVEKGLDISTDAWTTALEKKTYDFTSPQPLSAEMDRQLLNIIADTDASVKELASLRFYGASQKYCNYLRKKSLSAIRNRKLRDQ